MANIKFNKKIYPEKAIRKAIADYSQSASFAVSEKQGYFSVDLRDFSEKNNKFIVDEFSNYVLSLVKQ